MAVLNGNIPDKLPVVPQCFMLAVETAGMKINPGSGLDLDMKEARQLVPADTVLMGNIDPSFPLLLGTPADIENSVKQLVESTRGHRHIISSGCAMGRNTSAENFKAFVAASRRFGSYEEVMRLQSEE